MKNIIKKAKKIRLVTFDVDGVLTDGGLILGENGNEYKIFNVRDGHGLVMLRESGCYIAVVTARSSKIVAERMQALGIEYVYQGQNDKAEAITLLKKKLQLEKEQVAYVGDDLIDLPAMRQSGLSIAVANAHPKVIEYADWTTSAAGGRGAAREVCELIMKSQDTLDTFIQTYLQE